MDEDQDARGKKKHEYGIDPKGQLHTPCLEDAPEYVVSCHERAADAQYDKQDSDKHSSKRIEQLAVGIDRRREKS